MPTPARRAMSSSEASSPCSAKAARPASMSASKLRRASARVGRRSSRSARSAGSVNGNTTLQSGGTLRYSIKRRQPPIGVSLQYIPSRLNERRLRLSASRITFLAVATSFTAVASLQSLIIPVLSTIGADLGADAVGQTWMLTAWLISAAVATPLLGRAGDLVGRRRMYLLALGAVAIGSLLSAFAPNLTVML